jgi:hypothetical protein
MRPQPHPAGIPPVTPARMLPTSRMPLVVQRYITYGTNHTTRRRPTQTRAFGALTDAQQRQIRRWQRDSTTEYNFADFDALVAAATPLQGSFLAIPSGAQTPSVTGDRLHHSFDILAEFDASAGGDVQTGEYRQQVRGTFTSNGTAVTHSLGGGRDLHATTFQEDGSGDTRYGYRSVFGTGSQFGTATETTPGTYTFTPSATNAGSAFYGHDDPGIQGGTGDTVAMDLEFQGSIVDTSRPPSSPSYTIASSAWSVTGSGTL